MPAPYAGLFKALTKDLKGIKETHSSFNDYSILMFSFLSKKLSLIKEIRIYHTKNYILFFLRDFLSNFL